MSYLQEFKLLIEMQSTPRFLRLWEEYCLGDTIDGKELIELLQMIKNSPIATTFGECAETVLTLWKQIDDQKIADDVLRLVLDIQTTNSSLLADLAIDFLKRNYQNQKHFNEKIRIVGLRSRHQFQGAITNYELLTHMDKGKFVFHTGGWGVGEIMDISLLREHVLIEFEGITTLKDISFENAFKNLTSLPSNHFLAKRFGDPDTLEKEARETPLNVLHLLLKDLGPKTASEIKDELCSLVIPEEDWSKWWQSARSKLKKDTKIKSPQTAKEMFELRTEAVSHEERFVEALKKVGNTEALIQTVHNFTRDFSEILKNQELKEQIKTILTDALNQKSPSNDLEVAQHIQLHFLLEDFFPGHYVQHAEKIIQSLESVEKYLNLVEVVALKKRILVKIREKREDWRTIFLHLLYMLNQVTLRDYLFKELLNDPQSQPLLRDKLSDLLNRVSIFPEAFFWYFQKLAAGEQVPLNDVENKRKFLEAYLILLHYVENQVEHRDLVKKMHQLLIAKRYALIRNLLPGASVSYLHEFLLLASKCHILSKQDRRILQSLAEVVQPSLAISKKEDRERTYEIIWTTQEGYRKIQERINHIGTVETVDNAKEIEAARALGDLRENSEYKFALERRSRLQSELKTLSQQLNKARILTRQDISTEEVGVGAIVDLMDSKGNKTTYTLLGPWDADPDKHILSFQSKLAQTMTGCKRGDEFDFQGEHYTVKTIKSYLGE